MKKSKVLIVIFLAVLMLVCANNNNLEAYAENTGIFTTADKLSSGIDLGDSPAQVRGVLGEPSRIDSEYSHNTGAKTCTFIYDYGIIIFESRLDEDYHATFIKITNTDQVYIRNCKVGMDYREVIANFQNDNLGKNEYWEDVLYAEAGTDTKDEVLPEYAYAGDDLFSHANSSYGVMGYYADDVPSGIIYAYENGKTIDDTRILKFVLQNGIVSEIHLTYKYSDYASWHFNEYLLGEKSKYTSEFVDIIGHWASEGMLFVLEKGIMNGTDSSHFTPAGLMTRGMLVTVLHRMAGVPTVSDKHGFTDIEDGKYYAEAVAWAQENGIISGTSDTTFSPNAGITREQLVTILYRYIGEPELNEGQIEFTDSDKISNWAFDAMTWAMAQGIITGKDGNLLDPQGGATRAETAAILHRFLDLDAA